MTKHKQDKARRRAKLVKKKVYSGDSIRCGVLNKAMKEKMNKPKMSMEELLAQRAPINEEQIKEGTENGL